VDEKVNIKEVIIAKALDLFSAKGYEGVSVAELTEASGITKPTLYYYFESKEGLFEAVCKSQYDRLNTLLTEKAVYNPNPKVYKEDIYLALTRVTNAYFSFALANKPFFRITLANMSMPTSSDVFKIVEKYHFTQFDIVERMFGSMAKSHGNLKGKSKTLAWSFIGTINSYISLYFSKISGHSLNDKTVNELVHQFMHGIYA
jgi:AcrR family transcriptional regulator